MAEFLRAWGYSVPRELAKATSKSMMAIGTKDTMAHVARALGEGVPIRHASHPYDALIFAGADPADVYIVDVRAVSSDVDVPSLFEALHRANSQGTFVALSDEPISLPSFVGRIGRSDAQQLKGFLMPEAAAQAAAPLQAASGPASEEPPRSLVVGGSSR
ncbi:DNA-binding protein [Sorangium sp. KYC3313]|uniref:DNA-binding protein n=1 Tax=Sorangium sp. KYC3313 TaxID=3449740 RepID=UPI003F89DD43